MNNAAVIYSQEYQQRYLSLNIKKIILEGRKALKPPPDLPGHKWADEYRRLPETSKSPGKWRTEEAPHTREIMDAGSDPLIREITIMGSSQIAKTEACNNIIGRRMHLDPCNIIIMHPTDKDVKKYVAEKFDPMIEETPVLRAITGKRKKDGGLSNEKDGTFRKKFIGGNIQIITARSTSATRGSTCQVTWDDDIDAVEIGSTKEGDPCIRLKKRTTTFPHTRLNIHSSTPSREGTSRIEKYYNDSDGRRWYVRCPYCDHEQELVPEQLWWEKETDDMFKKVTKHHEETAKYKCISSKCDALWTEGERIEALKKGYWKKDRPWIKDHAGFFISEIASTLSTMEAVARQITDAKADIIFDEKTGRGTLDISHADDEKLEALYNTVFGRTYNPIRGEETDPVELMERRDDFIDPNNIRLPEEALMLTAAVDVQEGSGQDSARLEVNVFAWGLHEEAWLVYSGTIPGDPLKKEVWNALDEFWTKKWYRKDGVQLEIVRKFIDSGALTTTVYNYTRRRQNEGIFSIKGSNKYGATILPRRASIVKGGAFLITIGTQACKHELMGRLKRITTPGQKYIHFPTCYCNAQYFKQLTSEVAVRKTTELIDYIIYEKKNKHDKNEALDLLVYNFAAMKHVMPNFEKIKKVLDREAELIKVENKKAKETDLFQSSPETPDVIVTGSGRRRRRTSSRSGGGLDSWRYS